MLEPNDFTDEGFLRIDVVDENLEPIENATIDIFDASDAESILDEEKTDVSGQSPSIMLPTPPLEFSMQPELLQPYSQYNILVQARGFEPVSVNGIQLFSTKTSIQRVVLSQNSGIITIGANVLNGNFPPKIPESEIKPMPDTGEIVLQEVVVPETVVVHDGVPQDSTANNYYVPFTEYIKNVASSEIYPTWPEETLRANIIAIISFTLNRVFTEWYRNKGYYFTITSSTAYDQKWSFERNIFENISEIVDEIFTNFVARPNVRQPILTQYCDGKRTTCSGMSQWGSKYLGDQNYSALQILRNYYGSDIYIGVANEVEGVPISWPGSALVVGSAGNNVRAIQEQLASIRRTYSAIPQLEIDGIYGERTEASVRAFQKIFDLPQTGTVDYATWYKISQLYTALENLSG